MLDELDITPGMRVLKIGTGYHAAVLRAADGLAEHAPYDRHQCLYTPVALASSCSGVKRCWQPSEQK